jgi:membrane protein required for colicin V production
MTALDILVLLVVGGSATLGMSRGFVTETLSLGAWVFAIAAVKVLHSPVTAVLMEKIGTEAGAAVLAFALVFGVTMLVGRLIARRIGEQSKKSAMGPLDRVLGLGFGAIKGLIGASLIFLFVTLIYDTIYGSKSERPSWMQDSKTYPLLHASSGALVNFVEDRRKNGGEEAQPDPI